VTTHKGNKIMRPPGFAGHRAGETPEFTKLRLKRRAAAKKARKARKGKR
jgi:hypothetical protein